VRLDVKVNPGESFVDFGAIGERTSVGRFACPHVLDEGLEVEVEPHLGAVLMQKRFKKFNFWPKNNKLLFEKQQSTAFHIIYLLKLFVCDGSFGQASRIVFEKKFFSK
jgi:hypothetical protein